MSDTNGVGKPGSETSEYKTTKWAMLASTLLPVAAMILEGLSDSGMIQNKFWLAIIGGATATLASLGYTFTRGKIKAAESIAFAHVAAARDQAETHSKQDLNS